VCCRLRFSVYGERLTPGSEEHQQMAMTIVTSSLAMLLAGKEMPYCD